LLFVLLLVILSNDIFLHNVGWQSMSRISSYLQHAVAWAL